MTTGKSYGFFSTRSVSGQATVASKPSGVYTLGREWLVVVGMSSPAKNDATNNVVEIWHVPPARPSTISPAVITWAIL